MPSRLSPIVPPLLLAATLFLLAGEHADSASKDLKSAYVKLSAPWLSTVTSLYVAEPDSNESPVRPRINLTIANRSKRAFWFRAVLTAPEPHPGRTGRALLEPRKSLEFESTQDAILADTDYRFDVTVFGDSAFTDTLEVNSTQFRFPAKAVREIEKRVAKGLKEQQSGK